MSQPPALANASTNQKEHIEKVPSPLAKSVDTLAISACLQLMKRKTRLFTVSPPWIGGRKVR